MIHRIEVKGYKSLRDCTIRLTPLTVILGPNGSGKSNFLDLVGLLSRLVSSDTIQGAFDDHRGRPLEAFHSARGFGKEAYDRLLEEEQRSFSIACDLELHPGIVESVNRTLQRREGISGAKATYTRVTETRLRYEVEISLHPKSGELFVTNESLRALRRDLRPKAPTVRSPFLEKTIVDGEDRFVARVERQSHPRYFDTDRVRTLLSELSDPVYHPHVVAAAREIASWRVYYVEPNRMREEVGVRSAEDPGRAGESLAPYYYFLQQKHPATLRGIVKSLQGIVPGTSELRVDVREGTLEIVKVDANGAEYPARLLSEGTLRLLCILGIAVAPSPPALVVYEEPENGVNPARLDEIAQIIRNAVHVRHHGTQFLVTTHSLQLCDLLHEDLVTCRWSEREGTVFEPFDRDAVGSLFFPREVQEVLDGVIRAGRER
jgi:predicted ATPase